MMHKTNPSDKYCADYVHELENSSLSEVLSEWKLEFMWHDSRDNTNADELKRILEEIGIEIIGDMDIQIGGYKEPDFIIVSTDTLIDEEVYGKIYEKVSAHWSFTLYEQSTTVHLQNGTVTYPYYNVLEMPWVEVDIISKHLYKDEPEAWADLKPDAE